MVAPASGRSGFALIVVLLLMAVGSALMVTAMNGSLTDTETVRAETLQRRALVHAESQAWLTFSNLRAPSLRAAPLGRFETTTNTDGDITLTTTVDKVDTSIVWIVAIATIRRPALVARHRVGLSALIPRDTSVVVLSRLPQRGWAELF